MGADADTIYRVLTVYDVDSSKGERGVGHFVTALDHMCNLLKEGKGLVTEMVGRFIDLDSAMEKTRISIAGLFTAGGFKGADNFQTSMKMSSEIMQKILVDAAKLPGTAEDLQEIFQRVLPGGSNSGKSIAQIEELSAKMMAVGKTFNMPAEFVGREMAEMLEGRVSNRVTLFAKMRQFMGDDMTGQKFNGMSNAERFEAMIKAAEKFNPMIEEYGKSWDAVSSTTESYLEKIQRIGSGALFEGLKGELAKVNEWYEKHQVQIDAMVKKLGDELAQKVAHGFSVVKDVIGYIVEHRDTLVQVAEAMAAAWGMTKLAGGAGAGSALGKLGTGAGNFATGGMFGLAMAHMAGATDLANKGLMTLEGGLASLPGPIGQVSAGLLGLHAALQYAVDKLDERQAGNIKDKGDLGDPTSILNALGRDGMSTAGPLMRGFFSAHGLLKDGALDTRAMDNYMNAATGNDVLSREQASQFRDVALQAARAGYFRKHADPEIEFGPGAQGPLNDQQKIQQLLFEAGKQTTIHNTSIGAINMYNNIYDAEDSARVVQHLASDLRQNIEHPRQSASAAQHGR